MYHVVDDIGVSLFGLVSYVQYFKQVKHNDQPEWLCGVRVCV